MRRALIALLLAALLVGGPSGAATRLPLPTRLAQALAVPNIAPQTEGALVVDLATGATVFDRNGDASLAPASNEKLPLTFAALKVLGADYRFRTEILGKGQLEGSVWRGNLVLKGFGDPTLTSADLTRLAVQLRRAGIRHVTGRLIGDESWFDTVRTAPGWKPEFYISECPPLSALVVDGDWVAGHTAITPALAATAQLRRMLRARGITTGGVTVGKASPTASVLATVASEPLSKVLVDMDIESDNFIAEMLVKELGAEAGTGGTTTAGASVVSGALLQAGVPMAGVRFVDGSGLSLRDRTTARALAVLLTLIWKDPTLRAPVVAALPVAGKSGTLKRRLKVRPAFGVVRAKTGSTDESSALSGFAGDRYAFSLLQNGAPVAFYWAHLAQDRFAQALARGP
jgi:D-alanyl-D-alanine carboxypeptidase/D-alanyl-D-alanine-endopeptidase (penicillin-binding protein 4)